MSLPRSILTAAATFALTSAGACSAEPAASTAAAMTVALPGCTRESAAVYPFVRPRKEEKHAGRIADINQSLKGARADVLFFGDSILQRWPDADLKRAFAGRTVLNLGIRGERVADLLYRLRAARSPNAGAAKPGVTDFGRQSPETVVVLIGTNDLRAKSNCYIAEGTVEIASELRALYPKSRMIVLGILPRGNPQGQFAAQITGVNAAVAETGRRTRQFETADISAAYRCRPQQTCDVAIPKNYVHPSDKGYALLSAALRDYLARAR